MEHTPFESLAQYYDSLTWTCFLRIICRKMTQEQEGVYLLSYSKLTIAQSLECLLSSKFLCVKWDLLSGKYA